MLKRILVGIGSALILSYTAPTAPAINVTIDYTYDTSGFLSSNIQARNTLEAAADYYSLILEDTFSPVTVPSPLVSQVSTGVVTWKLNFRNPTTDLQDSIFSAAIAADEYRIYAGARSLPGPTAGSGSKGGAGATSNGGGFSQEEFNQYQQINEAFLSAANTRGEVDGFATWGGAISVDTDADNNWHYDYLTPPANDEVDLYSVVLHELGHALGLGNSNQWSALVTGSGSSGTFNGAASIAEYGSAVPMAFNTVGGVDVVDDGHWRNGTMSSVYGGTVMQEVLMDPSITVGTRKLLTTLDATGLTDIGWNVADPGLPGDYNHDNTVDAADYTVWRDGLGSTYTPSGYGVWRSHFGQTGNGGSGATASAAVPEPATSLLCLWAAVGTWMRRRACFDGRMAEAVHRENRALQHTGCCSKKGRRIQSSHES